MNRIFKTFAAALLVAACGITTAGDVVKPPVGKVVSHTVAQQFLPQEFGNLAFLYEGGDFVSANGVISQWNDSSGLDLHLVQSTASARPIHGTPGDDVVVNGVFATDTNWGKGPGWSIGSGVASVSSSEISTMSQSVSGYGVSEGDYVLVTYDVLNYASGDMLVRFNGGGGEGADRSANGTYSDVLRIGATTNALVVQSGTGTTSLSIDNVTVQKTTTDNFAYGDGIQRRIGTGSELTLSQPLTMYLILSPTTFSSNRQIFNDGNSDPFLTQKSGGSTPALDFGANTRVSFDGPALGETGIVTLVFNGADSLAQLNTNTPVTGGVGTGGFQSNLFFFGRAVETVLHWNGSMLSAIGYSGAHTAAQRLKVIKYLARKYGIDISATVDLSFAERIAANDDVYDLAYDIAA